MSGIFLFYKLTETSGWNMIHLILGLIISKKYWRVAKNLVPVLKVIQVIMKTSQKFKRKKED